ncbi:MAG TPA: NnrS family protein [Terriglobales bacterium]|nr:NnrS family protein [Terriglobales bacterium]
MPVIFALGFRPFFLLAGVFAVGLIAVWVFAFMGSVAVTTYYGQVMWHSHEMIFGYTVAVIAGFFLTAVRNWTNLPTPSGAALAAMAGLWLLGRIVPFFQALVPAWLIAVIDLLFLPALMVGIGIPLVRSGRKRNLFFLVILAAFFAANLLVHLQILGVSQTTARRGTLLGLNLTILIIVIMGGRVTPFFTERALQGFVPRRWAVIEYLAPGSVVGFLLAELVLPDSGLAGFLAAFAAVINGIRLIGWYTHRYWSVPLLWVLHLGYLWVVVGFGLKAAAAFGLVPGQFTLHAFTVGAIGVLTLGMMARVSLGHTGRPLRAALSMAVAFALLNLAALIRGVLPLLFPQSLIQLVAVSGALWTAAFLTFLFVYAPILLQPRIDGKPG